MRQRDDDVDERLNSKMEQIEACMHTFAIVAHAFALACSCVRVHVHEFDIIQKIIKAKKKNQKRRV